MAQITHYPEPFWTITLVVRSLLSVHDSGVNRPTKYTASGARGLFWAGDRSA